MEFSAATKSSRHWAFAMQRVRRLELGLCRTGLLSGDHGV
jgi:hypothetical protein